MVIYNKENNKPGRAGHVSGSSVRDRQMKAQQGMYGGTDSGLVATLTEQVVQLRNELAKRPTQGYTDEEFNNEVVKAVEASIAREREANAKYILELENKLKIKSDTPETLARVKELENEISSLKTIIAGKDETIEALKSRPITVMGSGTVEESDRNTDVPRIDNVFIDPSDKVDYKSNINVESKASNDKANVSAKVNKLKDLLGGSIG